MLCCLITMLCSGCVALSIMLSSFRNILLCIIRSRDSGRVPSTKLAFFNSLISYFVSLALMSPPTEGCKVDCTLFHRHTVDLFLLVDTLRVEFPI